MDYISAIWFFLLMLAGLVCLSPAGEPKHHGWLFLGITLLLASLLRLWPLIWCGNMPPPNFVRIELAVLVSTAVVACLSAGFFSRRRRPFILSGLFLLLGVWIGCTVDPMNGMLWARLFIWVPALMVLVISVLKLCQKHVGTAAVALRLLVLGLTLMALLDPAQEAFQLITKASSSQGNVIPVMDRLLWAILPTIACMAILAGCWMSFHGRRMPGLGIDVQGRYRGRLLWVLLVAVLFAGWFWTDFSSRHADAGSRAELVQEAKLIASSINTSLVAPLTGTRDDEKLPSYKTLKRQLADIVKASGSYRFAYLMDFKDGQVVFLVDNEPNGSKDESLPGDVYTDAEPELLDAFQHPHPLVTGPYPDQWGIWISGFAPIANLTMNRAPVYLGVDDNATNWCANLDHIRLEKILETLMLALFVVGLIVINYLTGESGSRQAASEARLRLSLQEAARLALVVEHTTDSVILTAANGAVEWVNASFTKMTGYSLREIQGTKLGEYLFGNETKAADRERISNALANGSGFKERVLRHHKKGRAYWVDIECQPLIDEADVLTGYMAIESNVTASVEAEQTLVEARNAADAANRAKSTFLATMSHEIRTPLNSVIGICSLLLETSLESQQRDYAAAISSAGETLLELINDILDYSKIEAGRIDVEKLPFVFADVMKETLEILSRTAAKKQIGLTCVIDPALPTVVVGDRMRLKQVLLNLVSNGVKFTDRGAVCILADLGGDATVRLTVKDTGIGMNEEVQSRLFVPFMQADSSITRKYGGSGLGLVISKRLVELMGGVISMQSRENEGTTFVINLPLPAGKLSEVESPVDFGARITIHDRNQETVFSLNPAKSFLQEGEITQKLAGEVRVLVAEDNPLNQKVITMLLSRLGITPIVVENGVQVLNAVKGNTFDLLLIDIQMPVMDGLEATRRLIEFYQGGKRPDIVALTANAFKEDREACFAAGMDGYLVKPITLDRLRAVLERVSGV